MYIKIGQCSDFNFVIRATPIRQILLNLVFIGLTVSRLIASQVTITPTDLAPTFTVDDTIPLIRLSFDALKGNPALDTVAISRTGLATDTDVPIVLIYEDTNQDDVIDDLTSPIGQASFSSGSATVSNLGNTTLSATTNWLIAYGIDINANQTNSAGGQINSTDITETHGTNITFSGITTGSYTLPVELTHWSAVWQGSAVELYWRTETETDNLKWIIQRSRERGSGYEIIYEEFKQAGEITTPFPTEYHYLDSGVEPGNTYYYILVDEALDGIHTFHGPVKADDLEQGGNPLSGKMFIKPNPFYRQTVLEDRETTGMVAFKIYSTGGSLVRVLAADAGSVARWDGRDQSGQKVPAGTYICRVYKKAEGAFQPVATARVFKLR